MLSQAQVFTPVEILQEVIMTKLAAYTGLLHRRTTALLPGALIIAGVLALVLICTTFRTSQYGSMVEATAAKAFLDSPQPAAVPAVITLKILPTDVRGKDLSWSSLTGDGSN